MMPQYVTENIFCSQMSAQHCWHPLYLRYKTKVEGRGSAVLHGAAAPNAQAARVPRHLSSLQQPDCNAAATDVPPRLTLPKGWAGPGNRRQQHLPNNTGSESAPRRGRLPAFILGVNGERLMDLGFSSVPEDSLAGAAWHRPASSLSVTLAWLNSTSHTGKHTCPPQLNPLAAPSLLGLLRCKQMGSQPGR